MVYRYETYGKNFIKKCKVSPDVYLQLALQLAYFRYQFFNDCLFLIIYFLFGVPKNFMNGLIFYYKIVYMGKWWQLMKVLPYDDLN